MSNRDAVLAKLTALEAELRHLGELLRANKGEELAAEFAAAKQARDAWLGRQEKAS